MGLIIIWGTFKCMGRTFRTVLRIFVQDNNKIFRKTSKVTVGSRGGSVCEKYTQSIEYCQ